MTTRALTQKMPGVFRSMADVGSNKGSLQYNASTQQHTIAASGIIIWDTHYEFHYPEES